MVKMRSLTALLALLTFLGMADPGWGAPAKQLVASGCSVSIVGYLSDLAADYEKLTGVKMFVRGGGSVIGLEDLITGKSDFGASCRGKRPDDSAEIRFVQVAWDALVFIVHPANPIDSISLAEARLIYEGKLRDWHRLRGPAGSIRVFLQRPTQGLSGVEDSIRNLVLGGMPPVPGPNVVELASTGIVEQLVEKTREGFGASGFSSARKRAVKMLSLDHVKPTRETILNRSYPLRRPLYLVVRDQPKPEVRAFLDFVLSPKGQELIGSYGAVSLRDVK